MSGGLAGTTAELEAMSHFAYGTVACDDALQSGQLIHPYMFKPAFGCMRTLRDWVAGAAIVMVYACRLISVLRRC